MEDAELGGGVEVKGTDLAKVGDGGLVEDISFSGGLR